MDRIKFCVNGIKCDVGCEVTSDVTLLDYLRNYLELRGTKYMCREGGCGACIVSVVKSPGEKPSSINSCLVSITSCCNWEITTIENVGNRFIGYHPIQKTLAENNGSQCGYCTPGWIMAMYNLLKNNQDLTMKEIEESFASNICRCTGYRPILEAYKKFAKDSPNPVEISDIEDIPKCQRNCKNCTKKCKDADDWCMVFIEDFPNILQINLKDGKIWYRVSTVRDIFEIWSREGTDSYMLVAGNTGKGVIPILEYPSLLIDVSGVSELKGYRKDQNLVINAGTTLTELLDIWKHVSENDEDFAYLKVFYDHLKLVAHIPVRNIGTIAGNLMTKHQRNEFTSDIFLLLETVGAEITICQPLGPLGIVTQTKTINLQQFIRIDMRGKVILNVLLPPLNDEYKIVTYKIMSRTQNAHAIVNAGFLYRLRKLDNVVKQSRIIFTGLIPPSSRAYATEKFIFGKKIFTDETLQAAAKILDSELVATINLPEPSPEYRHQLALGLFYKGLITLCPKDQLNARYISGTTEIHKTRGVTEGKQVIDTNPALWPVTQPIQKIEALRQCAAEVPYTDDMPSFPYEVFAALVLTTECTGNIASIDATEALETPGVLAFYSAKDIPGLNSFIPKEEPLNTRNEEVFCSGDIAYYNQPLGVVVAETRPLAERAAKMVHVTYKNARKNPVIDVRDAKKIQSRLTSFASVDATNKGTDIDKTFKGERTIYTQYHFPMETMLCVTLPSEDGLKVHSTTQWMDGTQLCIARALNIDVNSIDLYVRRLGGGFGLKISRSILLSIACSLAAWKLNRPCRLIQPITTNMRAYGKRFPCSNDYEVSVNKEGQIQYVDYKLFEDNGHTINESLYLLGLNIYYNVYDVARWKFNGYNVITDTHKNTWFRAPGTLEAIAMCETLIEHISYVQNIDPVQLRLANVDKPKYNDIVEMYNSIEAEADYKGRRIAVDKFNASNRWKKRGLRVAFMRWKPVGGQRLICNISVYHGDGTVALVHSGIEMGQGLNTKAVQVAAFYLKISVDKIKIKENNTIIGPNAYLTGGSVASQNVAITVKRACEDLLKKLEPVKEKMSNATWEEIVKTAHESDIDLQGQGFVALKDEVDYNIYGVAFAEVEVDILTGESEILRVDILEDLGRSLNPVIDVGQIEGAFVMGTGYWTTEEFVYDSTTGEILTDRTWNYKVPQARDIPQDFRVYMKKNAYSTDSILGIKAIGEPPICLAVVVTFALREAIAAARVDAGKKWNEWFDIDGPYTLEKICMNAATKIEHFKF